MADSTNLNSNFITDFIDEDLANGVNTRVQTRFPPEPNGYLHIGHAKAICIDFSIAEKYGGVCNLRLDDTNPSKEDVEYVDAIKEDIEWLGYKWNEVYYASSYFDFLYECAIAHQRGQGVCLRPVARGNTRISRHSYRTRQKQPLPRPLG